MSTPQDEPLTHQLATTFDHVQQGDLRWTERAPRTRADPQGRSAISSTRRPSRPRCCRSPYCA
ncbi:hypothetical protein GLP40_05335 [Nocardia sp. CT2-14]|uniref:Uncharacterized protein n=1 Tax=Nocardia aurantiaca TaxID=2675850 RepID=A0A6I3KTM8_9NOCA|nr:hypothetical protein [Nocardia aurantiaca]